MDDADVELYRHIARLAYLARFEVRGSWAAANRIAAAAVRKTRKSTKDSAMDRAFKLIGVAGTRSSWRARRRFGPVTPVTATDAQVEALGRLKRFDVPLRLGALLYLLDEVPAAEAASRVWTQGPLTEDLVRDAAKSLRGDLTSQEIKELLAEDELDPTRTVVSGTDFAADRRRRIRRALALGTAGVIAIAAGVWWFVLRTPPLGTYAGDPFVHHQSSGDDMAIGRWPARGESLGDTALLRRAADAWRAEGNPAPSGRPAVLFAGHVHGIRVVVMDATAGGGMTGGNQAGLLIAVYAEGPGKKPKPRVLVNPTSPLESASGIRLMDADVFRADPVLLPPGATGVEAGAMTAPPGTWHPVPVDARGVAEVPFPPETSDQRFQDATTGESPAGGLRFTFPDADKATPNPITLAESFTSLAPLLPSVEPVYDAKTPLSAADWCVAQKTAEQSRGLTTYSTETLSDTAVGPLPDGGGTGTVVAQTVSTAGFGVFPISDSQQTNLELATTAGGTCTATRASDATDPDFFVMAGSTSRPPGGFYDADAVLWTSPAKKTYLVVAASAEVSGIRVSGSVNASTDGRWLVVRVPDNSNDTMLSTLAVLTVDAKGHPCGMPMTSATSSPTYCSTP